MARFACLWIPDLALASTLRAEPELRDRRLAILDPHAGSHPRIIAGALRGLALSEARALHPDLAVRRLSLEAVRSAEQALFDVAQSITPRVEPTSPGTVQLDLDGTEVAFPKPGGLFTALESRLRAVELELTHMGIGATRMLAWLAARHQGGRHVVSMQRARRFLDPLPLALLDPPTPIHDQLLRWGVRTLGELHRLPRAALGTRLGPEAVALLQRAKGRDLTPFRPAPLPPRYEEGAEPEHAIDNLETLGFFLRAALDRLTQRLRLRGLAVRELWLELKLDSGESLLRSVGLAGATLETHALLTLVRLSLEREPPPAAVERMRVVAVPGALETAQLDLFLPPLPAPAALATTVARLEALCGPGHVGALVCEESHRPDAAQLERFPERPRRAPTTTVPLPRPTLALRALRPARPIRVTTHKGVPTRIELDPGRIHSVIHHAGPWRLFGEWWQPTRFARDYFDVELTGGALYRIYHDLDQKTWFADGLYD